MFGCDIGQNLGDKEGFRWEEEEELVQEFEEQWLNVVTCKVKVKVTDTDLTSLLYRLPQLSQLPSRPPYGGQSYTQTSLQQPGIGT